MHVRTFKLTTTFKERKPYESVSKFLAWKLREHYPVQQKRFSYVVAACLIKFKSNFSKRSGLWSLWFSVGKLADFKKVGHKV